jgi:carboxymethylenebutenolidase
MGGGLALSLAGTFADRVVAAASFHGGRLATDLETSPHRLAQQAKGKIYVAAAEQDPREELDKVAAALQPRGHTVEIYPGTRHGFAVSGHPAYDRQASERHWSEMARLFG